MKPNQPQPTPLLLKGRYNGMKLSRKGKIKGLRLQTPTGEALIKLPKPLKKALQAQLEPGMWLEVQVYHHKDGLKASHVSLPQASTANQLPDPVNSRPVPQPSIPKPLTIQVCRKGTCHKRGSKELCQQLQAALADRSDGPAVSVETTGCLKECKKGPNLRVLPDKKLYQRVQADQVTAILDKHLPSTG